MTENLHPIAMPQTPFLLVAGDSNDYLIPMDTMNPDAGGAPSPEADANRQHRLAWEAAMIAQADASIAAGRVVDEAEVDAWIDSIGTDLELPVPYSGR